MRPIDDWRRSGADAGQSQRHDAVRHRDVELAQLVGAAELAGHTLALQIAAFAFQVPFGVSQAATIRVGYHFGARDPAGMARAGWAAIAIGTGFMTVTASAMLLVPHALLSIYLDPAAPANAATVRVSRAVGEQRVVAAARKNGISSQLDPIPSIALGALEVTPLELVLAYAPFGNGGYRVKPRLIQRIESSDGRTLWKTDAMRDLVMDPQDAYMMTSMLRSVESARTCTKSSPRRCRSPMRPNMASPIPRRRSAHWATPPAATGCASTWTARASPMRSSRPAPAPRR